ncbi:hypothetical protein [Methanobrevibacter sp.]|uniref:hypothetical protein n=1 Tax=Methanobrevibacter sp. TaxID=66852 RepID=UPI0025E24B57|nr:hypothetical protein [Methanobrevibacter sp.]
MGLSLLQLIIEIIIFLVAVTIGIFVVNKLKNSDTKFLNPTEYLPTEEIHSIKQIYYLIMMGLCFVVALYALVFDSGDLTYFVIFDIIFSLYIAITIEKDSAWKKVLILFLIPYGSLTYLMFNFTLISLLDLIHIPVFLYLIKYYYDKFKIYTESNSLGITIVLLFSIVFVSFFITIFVEGVNPLDSLVMVSNAFTSNGYAVLGKSIPGKVNSLFLVWSGYLISGVGTATLTVALLTRHYNKRFDDLEKLIKENNKD